MKDIVFVRTGARYSERNWNILRARYPYAKQITVTDFSIDAVITQAEKQALTKSFWIIYDVITIMPTFKFDFTPPQWDERYIHTWRYLHNFKPSIGGIYHVTKGYDIPVQLKPLKALAGYVYDKRPSNFDIFFISFNEPFADSNLENLKLRYPNAQHVKGVVGIHNAHKVAANLSTTPMFWVIDADAILDTKFSLTYRVMPWDTENVYVWRSINPINDLSYGYGGVKLLPKIHTSNVDSTSVDMTTSISSKFVPMNAISNVTKFNVDPFNTWKSAFRECAKLSSRIIDNQNNDDTTNRLDIWCTVGEDKEYGKFCINGAQAGRLFGETYKNNRNILANINDFGWLYEQFSKHTVE